jgi:hypothetical protein
LDEIESTWEPADAVKEDVPVLYQAFVDAKPEDADRQRMAIALSKAAVPPTQAPRPRAKRGKKATTASGAAKTTTK